MAPSFPWPEMTKPSEDLLLGMQVGSFRIVRKLGEGGMGAVYLGEQSFIGSKVAVKFLHEHLASNTSLVQRFYAEARAVNLIGHENIVNIFDMNVVPPRRYYLIMEYLEGEPLTNSVATPMESSLAVGILAQVCDALQAAHERGVIHRDLKPENLFLLRRKGPVPFVKVLDFGIAKLFTENPAEQTSAGAVIGTPEYMAPEQSTGELIDGRADIYALGVIAYRMLTGILPFSGSGLAGILLAHRDQLVVPIERLNPRVSPELSAVVLKALSKRREDRYPQAHALRDALEAALKAAPRPPAVAPEEPREPERVPPPVWQLTDPGRPEWMPATPAEPSPSVVQAVAELAERSEFKGAVALAGQPPREVVCMDLSRGGMFVCDEGALPAVFSRVRVSLEFPLAEPVCEADVVRLINPQQAKAWSMMPGFAVQFVNPSASFREAVAQRLDGKKQVPKPVTPWRAVTEDAALEKLLRAYQGRTSEDPYGLFALARDAEFSEIHQRSRDLKRQLEVFREKVLPDAQRARFERFAESVNAAHERLSTPARRAPYDARTGNFHGVARCLSAGLTVTELDVLRKKHLAEHPGAESKAHVALLSGKAWETKGDTALALEEYERGLTLDPLNLQLQQRYWGLKRKATP